MTKIKLCGLRRACDVDAANALGPEYVGFVLSAGFRRTVSPEQAALLKRRLRPDIQAVGVFVNESPERVAGLLARGVIDLAQLHGQEDESYLRRLRALTDRPVIQALRIRGPADVQAAQASSADLVLLDSGQGTGRTFDWGLIRPVGRPYFLAGGLDAENVGAAITALRPYAVDVSSGIETEGWKDAAKMQKFVAAVHGAAQEETI